MSLPILQWNPINTEYGEIKSSIYIKPTLSLLEFANRNVSNGNRTLMVQISGTGHPVYDGTSTLATLDKTSDVPECRQNFYNATGMYLMTLNLPWFGYPNKNGSVTVYEGVLSDKGNVSGETPPPSPPSPPSPRSPSPAPAEKSVVENYETRNDNTGYDDEEVSSKRCAQGGMSVKDLSVIGLVVFTLVVIIFFLSEKR